MKYRNPGDSSLRLALPQILVIVAGAVAFFDAANAFQNKKVPSEALRGVPLPPFLVEQNMDLLGEGYSRTTLPEPRLELCQEACAKDGRCRAFTYIRSERAPIAGCVLRAELTKRDPNPRCILGIKQSSAAAASGVPPKSADVDAPVERHILADGTAEKRYADGTVKQVSRGGSITMIFPDGRRMSAQPVSTPPPNPPSVPLDSEGRRWLDLQNQSLINILRSLVGQNEANTYLNHERSDLSPYTKMSQRTQDILSLLGN
jgi:hypothetical protein